MKTLEDYIEYLKKELNNTEFLSKKALETKKEIILMEDRARELEKEIREREEDLENIILINIILINVILIKNNSKRAS